MSSGRSRKQKSLFTILIIMIHKVLYHILHICMIFCCFYMSSLNPERACQYFLNVKTRHICITKTKLKIEKGMFIIKRANQIWSTCESLGVWDECLTCSCDGQLWVHLSASKRNTWCESRRVTRDARVVARDAFKRARQHLWPMSLLCVVETRPVWRHTFLTSSHIPWQISNNEEMT